MALDFDEDLRALEPEEPHPIPVGWGVLFWGLVAFGAYYLWAYTPGLGGWSQERELAQAAGQAGSSGVGVNIFATVLFTAVATVAAGAIIAAFARRRRGAQGRG
jgi:hypothetical protein